MNPLGGAEGEADSLGQDSLDQESLDPGAWARFFARMTTPAHIRDGFREAARP